MPCPICFAPGERNMALNIQEARWAQGQSGWVQKISPSPEFDPQTVWLLAKVTVLH